MLTKEDFRVVIEHLTGDDPSLRAIALEDLWQYPSADRRILPYLERLLHDKTPCVLGIPYIFGEIRWLAAHALASERSILNFYQPVRLPNVVEPINTAGITAAEEAANIEFKGGIEGILENMAILRDMGYLPLYDLHLKPLPESSPSTETVGGERPAQRFPRLVPA